MMVKLALQYPEYKDKARKVKILTTTAAAYYGKGYQDVQHRVPSIAGTKRELGWRPRFPKLEDIVTTAWRWHVKHPNGYPD